jgi:integrase
MSSLTYESKLRTGYRFRAYVAQDGGRRRLSIWLGDLPEKEAKAFQAHADAILEAQTAGIPIGRQTKQWIERLEPVLRDKLQPIFAVDRPASYWIDKYRTEIAQDVQESTFCAIDDSLDHLARLFATTQIRAIGPEDLLAWQSELAKTRAKSTVGKIGRHIRAFFAWLVAQRAIDETPAAELATTNDVGIKHFVDRSTIDTLLKTSIDEEFSALIVLARYAGLRIPSEIRTLNFSDVDRVTRRVKIRDRKRRRDREVPLFPELVNLLTGSAQDGLVLPALASVPASTLSSRFESLIAAAGLKPWPRLWHSLRASRETELVQQFGLKAASTWIGNSEAVALKSYLLITDDLWSKATQ